MEGGYSIDHWTAVAAEIERARRDTAFYASRGMSSPPPDPAEVPRWVVSLPTIGKRDVRKGFPKGWVPAGKELSASLAREEVVLLATSGTTEDRLQVLWDSGWWDPQERAAMRIHAGVARVLDTPGYREAILTTPVCAGNVCHIGDLTMAERTEGNLLFLNQSADPTFWKPSELARMAAEMDAFAPHGLEADPAYLAVLCRWAAGRALHRPGFVQLTYEMTTSAERRSIEPVLGKTVQLYGSSECGVLFMECEAGTLHANAAHTHVDLLPFGTGADGTRLLKVVATTLGRSWMPLIRFDQGDLLREATAPCPCGRTDGPIAAGVEGRAGDLTRSKGGLPVTPAALDRRLSEISGPEGLESWQVIQAADGKVKLVFVPGPEAKAGLGPEAAGRLQDLYGHPVVAEKATALLPEPSGKYRLARAEKAG